MQLPRAVLWGQAFNAPAFKDLLQICFQAEQGSDPVSQVREHHWATPTLLPCDSFGRRRHLGAFKAYVFFHDLFLITQSTHRLA